MTNDVDQIDCIALDLIERFRDFTAPVTCELAEIAEKVRDDQPSAEMCHGIADAIGWLWLKP